MPTYERPRRGDLIAGLSVMLVLVPQSLAYAELAGVPPGVGLIAGTLPLVAAAFFVSSPYLQAGPTALHSLLIAGALSQLAAAGTPEYVALAALLAILVGVFRILFGVLRLGIAAYFVSESVLVGFTTGSAILIVGSQIPTVLGVSTTGERITDRAVEALADPQGWSWPSVGLAAMALVIVVVGKRVHKLFPSVLVAVAAAWALSVATGFDGSTIGNIPTTYPKPILDLPWGSWIDLIVPAFVMALVGFAEPSSIARTFATADRRPWSADREFVSQGVANVVAGATGAMPVGGSFGRSSLNRAAGAQTRWSGAITGLAVLALLPVGNLLSTIPKTVLSAIVISAVASLVRVDRLRELWKISRPQAVIALVTLVGTLVLDPHIDWAIMFGLVASLLTHLAREMQVSLGVSVTGQQLRLTPQGVLWFASINRVVEKMLSALADNPEATSVVVDLSGVGRLDLTAARELADMAGDAIADGIDWRYVGIPPHAERLVRGVLDPTR